MATKPYITVAAAWQFCRLQGWRYTEERLVDATGALQRLLREARLAKDIGPGQRSQQWRVSTDVQGRRQRLELIVAVEPRPEGNQPQVIAVRLKGRAGR